MALAYASVVYFHLIVAQMRILMLNVHDPKSHTFQASDVLIANKILLCTFKRFYYDDGTLSSKEHVFYSDLLH